MKKTVLILLMLPLLTVQAYAVNTAEEMGEELDIRAVRDTLPEELREIGGELTLDGSYDSAGALERLWNRLLELAAERLREYGREAIPVFTVTLLCTVGGTLTVNRSQGEYIELAGCAAIALLLSDGLGSMIGQAMSTMTELSDYAKAALPVIYSAAAACGAPGSASARYGVSCMALELMMALSQRLLLPLTNALIALSVCTAMYENPIVSAALKLGKKAAGWIMTGMTVVFTGFLSLTGIVTGSTDAAAVKAAKTVISAAVPVVGKILSDAASSVLAAASVVRNTAGAFGMIAVCSLCLAPFVAFAVKRLLFLLASAVAEAMAGGRIARLLEHFSAVMGILLGLVAAYGLMLLFCFVSAIRTVTG